MSDPVTTPTEADVLPPTIHVPPAVPLCMTEGCGKERKWKGLCSSCYGQAKRLIDAAETTWQELETMGLCVLDDKPFTTAFKRKKREQAT